MPLSSSQIENILDRVSTKTGVELSSVSFSLFHSGTLYPTLLYGQNIVALRLNFEIRDYFRQRVSKNRRSFKVLFFFLFRGDFSREYSGAFDFEKLELWARFCLWSHNQQWCDKMDGTFQFSPLEKSRNGLPWIFWQQRWPVNSGEIHAGRNLKIGTLEMFLLAGTQPAVLWKWDGRSIFNPLKRSRNNDSYSPMCKGPLTEMPTAHIHSERQSPPSWDPND